MRIVVALGGNALGNNPSEQLKLVKNTAKQIVKIVSEGNEVVVVHGNGPQVGMINLAFDSSYQNKTGTPLMPFAECGAMSQGYIGYHLQQAISDELKKKKINKECITVITQVEVSKNDPAFDNPTKPVGMFYNKKQALEIEKEKGYVFMEDANRGYRRVVASPKPKNILELDSINKLIEEGKIVITCGGGGIPVIKEGNSYQGVDAVIDKDNAACLLALSLNADALLILTAVKKVCIHFGNSDEEKLDLIDIETANKYIEDGEFAKGSMLPKVEACVNFVNNSNGYAVIAALDEGEKALTGKKGTKIVKNKNISKKNKKKKLTIYTILIFVLLLFGALSYILPQASFAGGKIINGSGVVSTKISDILMSPILGFKDSIDICIFIMILGAFIAVTSKTMALENGINNLIKKLKGKETYLIPILMFLFSIGGTTFGMQEETICFYALLSGTMFACGMDTLVASAIIILGCGVGVLGSTVNPFVIGAAIDAIPNTININHSIIITIGTTLWIISYVIATLFVMKYAKKVKKNKSNTYLSAQEQNNMQRKYSHDKDINSNKLNAQQKITLIIFGLSFAMMILGFIPWDNLGINVFSALKSDLLGKTLGNWYFAEASLWFLLSTICICLVNGFSEKDLIDTIISGISDMIGVILIISISRGASIIMKETYLDNYIIYNISNLLNGMPAYLFTPCDYLLHMFLSILVPSSSALANLSMPVMAQLVQNLGFSVETNIMILSSSNGLVNLVSPMCGVMISGLSISGIEYTTWLKWVIKLILTLGLISIFILTLAMLIF